MAELSGVLRADFSSFYAAVQKAETDLKELETSGEGAAGALSEMSSGFKGEELTAELEQVATATKTVTQSQEELLDAIGESGGRIGAASGGLKDLGSSAAKVTPEVNSLMGSVKQFDDVLDLGGVNIMPYAKGLEQIGEMAGKSVGELGALGTAGAAAGAFMVGWKIGEFIDGLTGASTAVEKLTKSLMGWGTESQTAGAVQDTINRAVAQGAPATISYTDAIAYNAKAFQQAAAAKVDYNKRLEEGRAQVAALTDADMKEIAAAQQLGATEEFLMTKYHLTADAVKLLTERTDAQAEADKKAAAAAEEAAARRKAAIEKQQASYASFYEVKNRLMAEESQRESEQAAMFEQLDIKAMVNRMNAASAAQRAEEEAAAKAEADRIAANQREIDAILQVSAAHTAGGQTAAAAAEMTVAGYQGVAQQIEITGEAVKEWINLMKYTAEAQAILSSGSGLFTTQSQRERIAAIGGGGGGGTTVFNNSYNIVDTESNIAKRVGDNIMKQVKAGTQLGTA